MAKINVLGFEVANLIAAGEVVDRPSSVVKELVENAIDSGATSVTVEIKRGGTTFIRVADNGCGIEYDELPTALLRHATSKIKDATDLDAIITLGFRGEALAAISSVSKVRIMSKRQEATMGGFLEAHAGKIINHIESGCADGTTVIVEDLFYNVPARKKFLKKDATESASVTAVIEKVAMSKPDISFRFIVDGEVKYITSGDGSLQNTIYALLGRDVSKKSIKVDREEDGIRVFGFISTPELVRSNRNLENFYINGRYIKSKTAGAALEQAFLSYIPSDKFPFCVLNIEIDPSSVDVNVHPSKLEVKFSNEKIIFEAVYYAVRTALANNIQRPELYSEKNIVEEKNRSVLNTVFPVNDRNTVPAQKIGFDTNANIGVLKSGSKTLDYSSYEMAKSQENATFAKTEEKKIDTPLPKIDFENKIESIKKEEIETPKQDTNNSAFVSVPSFVSNKEEPKKQVPIPDYKIIGEAFNSYVIVELGETLYMIDKHAAHERIIFEELKEKTKLSTPSSQMLIMPIDVYLTSDEMGAVSEWGDDIKKTGFAFDEKSSNTVSIYQIPTGIEQSAVSDMFITFTSRLIKGEGDAQKTRDEFFEQALYQASCKAAIKAGRIYDMGHIKWICDRVLTLDNIKYCPHGRPVAFEITKRFLEKQFERIK